MDVCIEEVYHGHDSVESIIRDKISRQSDEQPFYVLELMDVYKKHLRWLEQMPNIKPFFAVKCNNITEILKLLASLEVNFDCASKSEIEQVLALGVHPSRITFSNTCKSSSFIAYARQVGVDMMPFDNEHELCKIAQVFPAAKLVLRIKGYDEGSRVKMNEKFGASFDLSLMLLRMAKKLDMNVVGLSFHNGSDCMAPVAYRKTLRTCRQVFDAARAIGFDMYLLNIGGGFPGVRKPDVPFEQFTKVINLAIEEFFPQDYIKQHLRRDLEIMAEPGRFYVSSAMTYVTQVIGKRVDDESTGCLSYFMSDGMHGAFNPYGRMKFEPEIVTMASPRNIKKQSPEAVPLKPQSQPQLYNTILWGPTCHQADAIKRDFLFPELNIGDWIMFRNMGDYAIALTTQFNGFNADGARVILADSAMRNFAMPSGLSNDKLHAKVAHEAIEACDLETCLNGHGQRPKNNE